MSSTSGQQSAEAFRNLQQGVCYAIKTAIALQP